MAEAAAAIDVEEVPCPLCGSRERDRELLVRDHEYESTPRMSFPLRHCRECSLWYLSPRPAMHELGKIYPPEYGDFHTEQEKPAGALTRLAQKVSVRAISNRLQRSRYRAFLAKYARITETSTPRVLDVGCGDGHKLSLVREIVPGAKTVGVEIAPGAAARAAKKHEVIVGDFLAVDVPGSFDLVVSSHVIEHVADPVAFLAKIRALLAPGGIAIIDTPNIETPLFRMFGRHWGGIHAPRHWVLFGDRTLGAVAAKAGLEVLQIAYMPIQIFGLWTVHSALYERAPRLASALFHPQRCVNAPSLYYTALMAAFDALDRVIGVFNPRLGQLRAILRRPA